MRRIQFILLLTSIYFFGFSQTTNFQWAKQMGGSSICRAQYSALDNSGNIYTTGLFLGTVDFDPGPGIYTLTPVGSFDIFVTKLDASGNFVWAKQMGGTSWDESNSIAIDASGNVYTTGVFFGQADFDPGVSAYTFTASGTRSDIFVSKLNSSGSFVWAKQLGGDSSDVSESVVLDNSGNIYTTGNFKGVADFDPSVGTFTLNATQPNVFVSKLDNAGNYIWAKQMISSTTALGKCVTVDGGGDVYLTGRFSNVTDFDPGPGTFTLTPLNGAIFISKLNSLGGLVWAKGIGGGTSSGDVGNSISVDPSGNVYTVGNFSGVGDYDPGTGIYNMGTSSSGAFISKLDILGNFVWAKAISGSYYVYANSVVNNGSNIYLTGSFNSSADFDPGSATYYATTAGYSSHDVFILNLDASGNFVWVKQMGGTSLNFGYSINRDAAGNIYTTGEFQGTSDYDEEAGILYFSCTGNYDSFVHKMGQSPLGISESNESNLNAIFPNPAVNEITIKTELKSGDKGSIIVRDITGRKLYEGELNSETKVDISNFANGTYIANIYLNGSLVKTRKFVKVE